MTDLNTTHSNVENSTDYIVMFGNQVYGEKPNPNQSVKSFWRKQLERSKSMCGDVSLFYNGKLIRSVINMENRILDKDRKYPCEYYKH
jgi:hypothetical protein